MKKSLKISIILFIITSVFALYLVLNKGHIGNISLVSTSTKEEQDIYGFVCELPQNYRTVIYLLYYEGYKVNEIAKLMSKPEGTIKIWLYRAREILKEKIEGGFENE